MTTIDDLLSQYARMLVDSPPSPKEWVEEARSAYSGAANMARQCKPAEVITAMVDMARFLEYAGKVNPAVATPALLETEAYEVLKRASEEIGKILLNACGCEKKVKGRWE